MNIEIVGNGTEFTKYKITERLEFLDIKLIPFSAYVVVSNKILEDNKYPIQDIIASETETQFMKAKEHLIHEYAEKERTWFKRTFQKQKIKTFRHWLAENYGSFVTEHSIGYNILKCNEISNENKY